jgi:hypothetical protein
MKDKYYNLTDKPNVGVKDKAPTWMDSLFEKGALDKKEAVSKEEIRYMMNPADRNAKITKKCEVCGIPLNGNEVGFCSKCN